MKAHHTPFLLILLLLIGYQTAMTQDSQAQVSVEQFEQQISQLKDQLGAYKPGTSRFLLRGYAHSGLEFREGETSFVGGSFNPLVVFKQSDRLLFEGELELELEGAGVNVGLEYANMSYLLSESITLRAGKFLVPFGIFVPNLHPAWINKFPTRPLGAGHDGVVPGADIGLELRGAGYLGPFKTNYSIYAVNGPQLNDGSVEAEEGGVLHYGIIPDNNKGKALGGRIGFFPLSNSSLEIGLSGQFGKVGGHDPKYEDISAQLFALDLSYVQNLPGISSVLDMKAQYSTAEVDEAEFPEPDEPGEFHSFENTSKTYFVQASIRPAFVTSKFIQNLEIAGRYSNLETPEGAPWEAHLEQWDISLNYWIDWRTALKFSYQSVTGETGGHGDEDGLADSGVGNAFFIHWAIGF